VQHGEALSLLDTEVASDWVDYNGHMNDAAYALVFSRAIDALMDRVGLDAASRKASGRTLYTMQSMLHYMKEAGEGAPLSVVCRLLEHDDKRMRVWLDMRAGRGGDVLAGCEQLLLSIDKNAGPRAAPWRPETLAALDALAKAQRGMATPELAGRGIALRRA
jgi:acyl-CoA thioester hydrolase